MKIFRELAIEFHGTSAADFVALLEKHAANGWERDAALGARRRRHGTQSRPFHLFTRQGHPTLSPAHLALVEQDQDRLVVSNIFSEIKGELTHDEYNGLLMEFHDAILAPVSAKGEGAVRVTLGDENQALSNTTAGVVKNGVIMPGSPIPEGALVEIRQVGNHVEVSPELQAELVAWQQAGAEALSLVADDFPDVRH
jgi:hypothetical protein